ncbi:MAG: extracellular solute-binding protein [Pseudomonadota bacterium]
MAAGGFEAVWHIFAIVLIVLFGVVSSFPASAEPKHAIAMHGDPDLPPDFENFPYVNPNAPKGGTLVLAGSGAFDSLNPFVLKGKAPWLVRFLVAETLMTRSYDEPFSLYPGLAQTIETPPDRSWVQFALNPDARFSDGSPVTAEDVVWSFETLGTEGSPVYRNSWKAIKSIRAVDSLTVRIDFSEANRELPLIMGLRPVLKKAHYDGRGFADAKDVPIGSGPYLIDRTVDGRMIEFRRNPDWWGAGLPAQQGLHNFDRVRLEYFRNGEALWEAVKTGAISLFSDADPLRWDEGYDFPLFTVGTLQRGEIGFGRPSGMEGFVFNTRRPVFADRRVREALAMSFDWEWVNARLYRGSFARIQSYFSGSDLGATDPMSDGERALLTPFTELPEGTLEAVWRPPSSDGTGRDRRNLRKASRLLQAAGWAVNDGKLTDANGEPFVFEILVQGTRQQTLASLWSESLTRLGITAEVRLVDASQYQLRRSEYDFDMIVHRWGMSPSPGIEQRRYFASQGRTDPGSRNYMGVADPAVDAMIDAIVAETSREKFRDAVRALDRVLMSGIYVIPFGVLPADRVVWHKDLARPEKDSLFGYWGWWAGPGVWWHQGSD